MINKKIRCYLLLLILLLIFGVLTIFYREYEIVNYYNNEIKECFVSEKDDDIDSSLSDELLDKCKDVCSLVPINSEISLIKSRLDILEKKYGEHKDLINENKDIVVKTELDLNNLKDQIYKTEKELEDSLEENEI